MPSNDPNNRSLPVPRPTRAAAEQAPVTLPGAVVSLGAGDKPSGPPALSAAPSASALLQALRRRWALALVLAAVAAAGAVALTVEMVPGQYTAVALLKVSARSPGLDILGVGNEGQVDPLTVKNNQEPIIKSLPVLNAALNKEDVRALPAVRGLVSPAGWLAKTIKIDFKGPEILQLSMSTQDPAEAQKLVNAVADAYVAFTGGQEKQKRDVLLTELRKNYKEGQLSLRQKEWLLNRTLARLKVDDVETAKSKHQSVLRQLEDATKEERALSQEKIKLQNELQAQRDDIAELPRRGVPDILLDKYLHDDPVLKQYQVGLDKLDLELREAIALKNEEFAQQDVLTHRRLKQAALREVQAYRRAQVPRVVALLRAEAEVAAAKLERDLAGLRKRQDFIKSEVERLDAEAKRLAPATSKANPDVGALQDEVALQTDALKKLGDRIELLKLGPSVGSQVTLIQPAELPRVLDTSRQFKLAGVAGAGTFLMVLFAVSLWEFRTRKINAVKEVVDGLGLPLVGTLPALPASARRPLPGPANGRDRRYQGQLTESVDALRTLLLHAARTDDLQVVMVTSADAGEGKTSVASHLAASLARAWRKTLLIDGDLRHPAVHKLFEQPAEPGFSEVLRGEAGAQDAIRPTAVSRLWVMPAGHWDSHAVQALAQESVRSLFEELKGQYDFIVVDSCPVLPVADSLLLAQHVDAVLLSVLRDVSRAPAVHAAQQRLAGLGVRTLGAVVIGADGEAGGAAYAYQTPASV
jgi:capsular exopolysaccharide synthesis family protein